MSTALWDLCPAPNACDLQEQPWSGCHCICGHWCCPLWRLCVLGCPWCPCVFCFACVWCVCLGGCLTLMQMLTCVPCCPTYDTYILCLILAMQRSRKTRPFPGPALSVRTHQGPTLGGCHLQGMSSAPQPGHPPTCPWTETACEGPDVSLQPPCMLSLSDSPSWEICPDRNSHSATQQPSSSTPPSG